MPEARLHSSGALPRLCFAVPGWGWGDGDGGAGGARPATPAASSPAARAAQAACPAGACVAVTVDPRSGAFRVESPHAPDTVRTLNRMFADQAAGAPSAARRLEPAMLVLSFFRRFAPGRIREVARLLGFHPVDTGSVADDLEPRPQPGPMEVALRALSPASPLFLVVSLSAADYSPAGGALSFQVARGPGGEPPVVRPWSPPAGCVEGLGGGAAWGPVLAAAAEWAEREGPRMVLAAEAQRRLRVPTAIVAGPGRPAAVVAVHGGVQQQQRGEADQGAAGALGTIEMALGPGGAPLYLSRRGGGAPAEGGAAQPGARLASGAVVEAAAGGGVRVVIAEGSAPRALGGAGLGAETIQAVRCPDACSNPGVHAPDAL